VKNLVQVKYSEICAVQEGKIGWDEAISQWKVLLLASVAALAKYTAVERR